MFKVTFEETAATKKIIGAHYDALRIWHRLDYSVKSGLLFLYYTSVLSGTRQGEGDASPTAGERRSFPALRVPRGRRRGRGGAVVGRRQRAVGGHDGPRALAVSARPPDGRPLCARLASTPDRRHRRPLPGTARRARSQATQGSGELSMLWYNRVT